MYDQTDPGAGVRDQRQSQRSFLQIPARLRHPLRRTQSGTRPPARRPGALRLRRNPARPILLLPRRLHRGPAAARLDPQGAASRLSRTLLPDLHLLLRLLRGLLRLQPADEQPGGLPGFAPAASRNPGQYVRNQGAGRTTAAEPAHADTARNPRLCHDRQLPGQPLPGERRRLAGEKILHPLGDRRHSERHEGERRDTLPGESSTSITRIIRGPTNTPSRPSKTPFAATCSSGSCG